MKKSLLLVISFLMIFSFSACQEELEAGDLYLPKTELYTRENAGGFYREYKNTYEYDDNGNVIEKVEYTKGWIFYVREAQYDTKYTYNPKGDISQELVRAEDFSTSLTDIHNVYEEGYNYIYNEKQQLIGKEITTHSDAEGVLCGYEYEYDEQGNCVKEYTYYTDGRKDLEVEKIYDSQNQPIKKRSIANFLDSSWLDSETEYTYDLDKKLIYEKTIHYAHYEDDENRYSQVKYTYDELNRIIKKEATSFDSNGEITDKYVSEYKDFVKIKLKDT